MISSDRRFRFSLDPGQFWTTIDRVEDYPRWWPWLRSFDGIHLRDEEEWHCRIQPPVPYVVRLTIRLVEVRAPHLVVVCVSGDVVGHARIEIEERATGCEVYLCSELDPHSRFLRGVARAAHPVAQFGHDWVIDTGARQFARSAIRSPCT